MPQKISPCSSISVCPHREISNITCSLLILFTGDFNDESNKFGDVVVIDTLDARGDAFFTVTDVYRSDVHCMYGLIDTDNEVDVSETF
jgi:hypothetical protein